MPLIPEKPLPQSEAGTIWVNDTERYRLLADRHDALTRWVDQHCK